MNNAYTPTPVEESVHILNSIFNKIDSNRKALAELYKSGINPNTIMVINAMFFEFVIIHTNSYLDEFDNHFSKSLNEDDRKYISPFSKRIKKEINFFSDIKKFRNQLAAHNLRKKDLKSVPLSVDLDDYKVPQNMIELGFLIMCIHKLTDIINGRFEGVNEKLRNLNKYKPYSASLKKINDEFDRRLTTMLGDLEEIAKNVQSNI